MVDKERMKKRDVHKFAFQRFWSAKIYNWMKREEVNIPQLVQILKDKGYTYHGTSLQQAIYGLHRRIDGINYYFSIYIVLELELGDLEDILRSAQTAQKVRKYLKEQRRFKLTEAEKKYFFGDDLAGI